MTAQYETDGSSGPLFHLLQGLPANAARRDRLFTRAILIEIANGQYIHGYPRKQAGGRRQQGPLGADARRKRGVLLVGARNYLPIHQPRSSANAKMRIGRIGIYRDRLRRL